MKQFFKKWKTGIMTLDPLSQLKAKRNGAGGQVIGMFLGIIATAYQGYYVWVIFLLCTLFVLIVEWLGLHQQVKQLEKLGGD